MTDVIATTVKKKESVNANADVALKVNAASAVNVVVPAQEVHKANADAQAQEALMAVQDHAARRVNVVSVVVPVQEVSAVSLAVTDAMVETEITVKIATFATWLSNCCVFAVIDMATTNAIASTTKINVIVIATVNNNSENHFLQKTGTVIRACFCDIFLPAATAVSFAEAISVTKAIPVTAAISFTASSFTSSFAAGAAS